MLLCFVLYIPMSGSSSTFTINPYLYSEDFEGSENCYSGDTTYQNCDNSEAWAIETGTADDLNFQYATSPAPLEGSYSLLINADVNNDMKIRAGFTSSPEVSVYMRLDTIDFDGSDTNAFIYVNDDGVSRVCGIRKNASAYTVYIQDEDDASSGNSRSLSTDGGNNIDYNHWWLDYSNVDDYCKLYISTTATKPASPEISITGDYIGEADEIVIYGKKYQVDPIIDKIRISTVAIGSDPQ